MILGGVSLAVIVVVAYTLFLPAENFDYSKIVVDETSPREHLGDEVVKKAVDTALSDINAKVFVARYDNPTFKAYVSYLESGQVSKIKNSESKFAFLPDASPVIVVGFDSGSSTAIPERPSYSVFIQPNSYRIYGSAES